MASPTFATVSAAKAVEGLNSDSALDGIARTELFGVSAYREEAYRER
jgi:hypothetical protein